MYLGQNIKNGPRKICGRQAFTLSFLEFFFPFDSSVLKQEQSNTSETIAPTMLS